MALIDESLIDDFGNDAVAFEKVQLIQSGIEDTEMDSGVFEAGTFCVVVEPKIAPQLEIGEVPVDRV